MSDITIVTAYFDIGRSTWTQDKGFPHYLHRTNDTYLERFANMATLDNEMVIFTSSEFVDRVAEYRKDKEEKTKIVEIDYKNGFKEIRLAIASIQTNPDYQKKINPNQVKNPEYWSADYVLVNMLKSYFLNLAIRENLISNDLAAWVDFGYCRNMDMLGGNTKWQYDFDPNKIHMFQLKEFDKSRTILDVIANNEPHMVGGSIIAGRQMWPILDQLIIHSFNELYKNNLVDDDQTLMLMSYLFKSEIFEIYKLTHGDDWLAHNSVFKKYNT